MLAELELSQFNRQELGLSAGGIRITTDALQTTRARRKDLNGTAVALCTQHIFHLEDVFLLFEAYLGGDVRACDGKGTGFSATGIGLQHCTAVSGMQNGVDRFDRNGRGKRCVARIVVHVANVVFTGNGHAFFEKVFVHVHQAAARKNLFEVIVLELLKACTAGDEDGFDV